MPVTNINYNDIKNTYADEIKVIMAKLAKGKSVEKGSRPEDMTWDFTWVEAIGFVPPNSWYNSLSQKEKDDIKNGVAKGIHTPKGVAGICLQASKGRWRGQTLVTSVVVPEQIHDFFIPEPPKAKNQTGLFLETIQDGQKDEEKIFGGYKKDGEIFLVDEDHFLLFVDPKTKKTRIAGGFQPTAKHNFDQCPEGGIFTYRNKKLYKMTKEEIKAILQNNPYDFDGIYM